MATTRLYDDPYIIKEHIVQSTFSGKYALNTPGNGMRPSFMEDPSIRLQKWGANMMFNAVNMESDLRGLTRKLNRDEPTQNCYIKNSVGASFQSYPTQPCLTDDTRHSNPAWLLRGVDNVRLDYPIVNPQAMSVIDKPFQDNLQTRILEKDFYDVKML